MCLKAFEHVAIKKNCISVFQAFCMKDIVLFIHYLITDDKLINNCVLSVCDKVIVYLLCDCFQVK